MSQHPEFTGEVTDSVANRPASWPVADTTVGFENAYLRVTVDTIEDGVGEQHSRVVVRPRGAVAVAAVDDQGRILLVQQFRHAVQKYTVEIPAGILDVAGESKLDAAARELAEEADVQAASWSHLLNINTTPGFCSEEIDVFLAQDLNPVPIDARTEREAEEADMTHWWVSIDDAVKSVFAGDITDGKTIAAIFAVARLRSGAR